MILFFVQNSAMSVTSVFLRGINDVFAMVGCRAAFTLSYRPFGTSSINAESHPRTTKTSQLLPLYEFNTLHAGTVPDFRPSVSYFSRHQSAVLQREKQQAGLMHLSAHRPTPWTRRRNGSAQQNGYLLQVGPQNYEKWLLASSCLSVPPRGTTRFPLEDFHEILCLRICWKSVGIMSVPPHATTRFPLDGFSWNLMFEDLLKICRNNLKFY
jgi:hypothetical protein